MELEAQERTKYKRMWEVDLYRKSAPGEKLVDGAVRRLGMKPGDSVIDFGCGTGRPAAKFQALGMEAMGIDIADNCLDEGVEIPLAIQPLWELAPFEAGFGFCTDVMEHIPPERVNDVLANIALTVGACYFQIATRPDSMGRIIGETLHLTVKDSKWWHRKLEEYFGSVNSESRGGATIVTCKA